MDRLALDLTGHRHPEVPDAQSVLALWLPPKKPYGGHPSPSDGRDHAACSGLSPELKDLQPKSKPIAVATRRLELGDLKWR